MSVEDKVKRIIADRLEIEPGDISLEAEFKVDPQ